MNQNLFKKEDYHAALREHSSILDCGKAIEDCVKTGDLKEALMFVQDINNSLETLKRMAEKKMVEDNMKTLLDQLVTAGVNVMVVRRHVQ
ncbi:YqaH family protein [Psychrobacillus sp. FSL K6-1415]|uniref:YqaH family protein n=1 Tax=Psychrobacillus sp. FSL K6-1415 TaxID=2921544 RepID=UPI0030F8F27B